MSTSPELRDPRSRNRVMRSVSLVLAVLATMLAFSVASPADAIVAQLDDECYVEVEEFKYEREKFVEEHKYEKYTQTRTRDFNWGSWEWSEWSAYDALVDWPGAGPRPWGDVPSPLSGDHDGPEGSSPFYSDNYNDRRYEYVIVDTRLVSDGYETTGWLTEPPAGDGWEVIDTRTVKGQTFPCPDASATPGTCDAPGVITPSESDHYTSNISGDTVTFTAVPPAVFGADVQTEFSFPEIAQLTGEQCDEDATPVDPDLELSESCEVPDKLHIPDTEGVSYRYDGGEVNGQTLMGPLSGTITAEAKTGYDLTDPEWSYEFDLAEGEPCPEEVTPVEPEVNQSEACEVEGTLVIPDTGGVVYLLDTGDGPEVVSGVLVGPFSGTLSAEAEDGHVLVGDEGWPIEIDIAAAVDCPPGVTTTTTTPVETTTTTTPDETTTTTTPDDSTTTTEDSGVGGIGDEVDEGTGSGGAEAGGGGTLPRTGAGSGGLLLVAGLVLGLGAVLRSASRRLA